MDRAITQVINFTWKMQCMLKEIAYQSNANQAQRQKNPRCTKIPSMGG